MKNFRNLITVSLLSAVTTLGAYEFFFNPSKKNNVNNSTGVVSTSSTLPVRNVGLSPEVYDFKEAASLALDHVVHVKNISIRTVSNPIFEYFYGQSGRQQQTQVGTGSGVIISEDGYIVTNNHVIQNASELEITLNNNKSYKAKLIGTDTKTDIALLKVDVEEKLPFAVFGDSDQVSVGEWVLAVGNPYNLNSTVTAGIISAKARNLTSDGIQSFIQTDAVVNPGNSGGALVNTRGELIGINTMISSNTGSYVGYSFAVPSNITRKVIEDIIEYGNVQRGILGIEGFELNANASKELNITQTQGLYINTVNKNTGAEKAGLKKGDIIVKINNKNIKTFADVTGIISTKRPNDTIEVTIDREGTLKTFDIQLTKLENVSRNYYGLELEEISQSEGKKFNLNQGVKIKDVHHEKLLPYADELKGSIILSIDGNRIKSIEHASQILNKKRENEAVRLELLLPTGQRLPMIISNR